MRRAAAVLLLALVACARGGGTVTVSDRAGDVLQSVNAKGEKPQKPYPPADLRSVRLEVADGEMLVRFTMAGTILENFPLNADTAKGPSWFLLFWNGETKGPQSYFVAILPAVSGATGGESVGLVRVLACAGEGSCSRQVEGAKSIIEGDTLRVLIPMKALPKLRVPFTWGASTSWNLTRERDAAWSDRAPELPASLRDQGNLAWQRDPKLRARFPG